MDVRAIEAIASLSKPLNKLRNPLLRKVMASRVTLKEACAMGKVSPQKMKDALLPLGIQLELSMHENFDSSALEPSWLREATSSEITHYDVRSIIEEGSDPLKEILNKFKYIEPGKILCIHNTFVPTPLIHLLKEKLAEDSFVERKEDKLFLTYFLKKNSSLESEATEINKKNDTLEFHSKDSFKTILAGFSETQIKKLDVRHLEMPLPMQTILQELAVLKGEEILWVQHKRIPIYLLEEIKESNFRIDALEEGENQVQLLFRK